MTSDRWERIQWLVLGPVLASLVPWFMLALLPHDPQDNHLSAGGLLLGSVVPVVGALGAAWYGWSAAALPRVLPPGPFLLAAIVLFGSVVASTGESSSSSVDQLSGLGLVTVGFLAVLPGLALVGGLVAARRMARPNLR